MTAGSYDKDIHDPKPKTKSQSSQPRTHIEEVTIGTFLGTSMSTQLCHTKCNALTDTGPIQSCLSEAYYHTLLLQK